MHSQVEKKGDQEIVGRDVNPDVAVLRCDDVPDPSLQRNALDRVLEGECYVHCEPPRGFGRINYLAVRPAVQGGF